MVRPWKLPIAPSSLAPSIVIVLSLKYSFLPLQEQNGRNIESSFASKIGLTTFLYAVSNVWPTMYICESGQSTQACKNLHVQAIVLPVLTEPWAIFHLAVECNMNSNCLSERGFMSDNIPPNRKEVLEAIDNLLESYENLPAGAMITPATQYDIQSVLLLLSASLRLDCNDAN